MADDANLSRSEILALTAEIVSAYAGNNAVDTATVPTLISSVFGKLSELAVSATPIPEALVPAIPIKRSVTEDHLVCLEDGKKLKTLRRHLLTAHGMTPEVYRARWGLKADYPMVAPNYSAKRQELAKSSRLGWGPGFPNPIRLRRPSNGGLASKSRLRAVLASSA